MLGVLASLMLLTACEPKKEYIYVGENWQVLHQLSLNKPKFKVSAALNKKYQVGEKFSLQVTSEKAGNLWIVQVDPNDEISFILPSKLISNQLIGAGEVRSIPDAKSSISVKAVEPIGDSLFAIIVTTEKVNWQLPSDTTDKHLQNKLLSDFINAIKKTDDWAISSYVVSVMK